MTKSIAAASVARSGKPLAFGLVIVAALVAFMLVVGTRSADAAFPGSNGKIVFWAARSIASVDHRHRDLLDGSEQPDRHTYPAHRKR